MKLLDEIIELLSDKNGSLTDALLKTKVLMHKIGHKELADWVNDELNGYPKEKQVPSYRIVHSQVMGNIQNMIAIHGSQPLPTGHLPEKIRKYLHEHEMRQSINVLEHFANEPKKHLTMPLGPEFYGPIGEAFEEGAWVQKAWIQMEPTQVMHGLTEVRSRLLDFVLGLQDKLGDVLEQDVKEAAKGIDAQGMFQNAVFGDNVTIQFGSHNVQKVQINIKKGDFSTLAAELKRHGVEEDDIATLQGAIEQDKGAVELEQGKFGPAVKGWMSRMMDKAINTAWNVEIAVAGGLIVEALKAYYF
jgi:hypothetical protein